MLQKVRQFFDKRSILEVDCCALGRTAPIDANIDAINVFVSERESGFLHTSPEYAMKRLLALGSGDIYYLGHVFRKGDIGQLHNPEFMMAEWYRLGLSFSAMIQETCEFLFLFLGSLPVQTISYREAFEKYVHIDYSAISTNEVREIAGRFTSSHTETWNRSSCIDCLLTHAIEPHLGRGELTLLIDYPPYQAALARIVEKNGEPVAERFEIYHEGIELANGYHELTDALELKRRFDKENEIRGAENREIYPLDNAFLSAMSEGCPACCGVSVGFDRALMLQLKATSIRDVLPFAWDAHRDLTKKLNGRCALYN